jgi:membrane associated rhomboid family serine protease
VLIPIGQEDATVRRHPWVSYSLIVLNIFVFAMTTLTGPGEAWRTQINEKVREIVQYFQPRPYLELPPVLAELCKEDCRKGLEQQRAAFAESRPMPPSSTVAEEQRKLDELDLELQSLRNQLPARRYGYIPAEGKLDRALTSMFVHGGWFHLLGNMLFLFVTGPFVEDVFGRVLFAGLYFLSGFAALAAHVAHFRNATTPLIGASGAIAGVMGAFLVRYSTRRIRMLFMPLFPLTRPRFTFGLPAFVILPLWFGEQFWYANHAGDESGVAFWAHVGGFAFGAAFAAALKLGGAENRWIHPAIEKELTLAQNPRLERALDARLKGNLPLARRDVAAVLAVEPMNPDAWRESFEVARAADDPAEMGRSAARLVELYARADERDLLVEILREVSAAVEGPLPAKVFLLAGSYLEKRNEWDLALEAYDGMVRRQPADPGTVRAHVRRAEIYREMGDAAAARRALADGRAHPACTDAMVQMVERALARLDRPPSA